MSHPTAHMRHTSATQRQQIEDVATSIGNALQLLVDMREESERALLAYAAEHAGLDFSQPGAQAHRVRLAEEAQTVRWSLGRLDSAIDALTSDYARTIRGLRP